MDTSLLAIVVFGLTYTAIASEKVDRTATALAGALALILLGVLSQSQAVAAIDFNTIGLLIGMMALVNILKRTGFFTYVGIAVAQRTGGRPWPVMFGFFVFTGVASAALDNVTTVLLMLPITLTIADHLKLDPRPFLLTQVIASNVGGTATLIGDPPNILIGSATGLTFVEFIVNLAPLVVFLMVLIAVVFWLVYGRRLPHTADPSAFADLDARKSITNPALLRTSLIVLGLTLVGFVLHGYLHLEPATVALAGATTLILAGRVSIEHAIEEVEWGTILFFVGLFIVVGALEHVGVLARIGESIVGITGGNLALTAIALLWFAALTSALVDNIPAVASLVPIVYAVARLTHPGVPDELLVRLPDIYPLWWSLALGACLGGNATLIGASANVVIAGAAARRGLPISFWQFTRIGLPIALLSLVASTFYIWLRFL